MPEELLIHKTVLITGAARRIGRLFALACEAVAERLRKERPASTATIEALDGTR